MNGKEEMDCTGLFWQSINETILDENLSQKISYLVPDSDFKDPSLRDDRPFVVKVSLHSEDLFLFRLGSAETLLLQRNISNIKTCRIQSPKFLECLASIKLRFNFRFSMFQIRDVSHVTKLTKFASYEFSNALKWLVNFQAFGETYAYMLYYTLKILHLSLAFESCYI